MAAAESRPAANAADSHPPAGAKKASKKPRKLHVPLKAREYFAENLGLLLQSDVPVGGALESLAATSHSSAMKKTLARMQADIEAGFGIADAMERAGIASRQTLSLVRLGEHSGRLVENLRLAAQQEEKRQIFRSKVRSALMYPVFVLSLTLVVGLGVAWFLLPRLSVTFGQLRVKLPWVSRVMIHFGVFLKAHGLVAVPLFLLAVFLIGYIVFGAPKTKVAGQRILYVMPGVGRLMREVEMARFGYLFGTLLEAGLPITQAIRLLADASGSMQYRRFYLYLAESLDDGFSIKESMVRYKNSAALIPLSVQQMIIAGERSGSLSTVLLTIGRTYEQKSDTTTENLETILEPVLLLFVAGGVMLVAIAVILPIYSLVGGLNQ